MLLSLFLDFNSGSEWLGGIVWKVAFALWIPQLLLLWLVLRQRDARPRTRTAKVLPLLTPFGVFVALICLYPAFAFMALMSAEVQWGWWLLTLFLPTLAGLLIAVTTKETSQP